MKSGYFTLAIGNPRYAELANILAYSLHDVGITNISILTDDKCKSHIHDGLFEQVLDFTDEYIKDKPYWGLAKLLMHKYLPYERSVFIDADSLAGVQFKGCDDFDFKFTTSYGTSGWGNWKRSQWPVPKLDLDLKFPTPTHQATSIMWYGGYHEIHEKAIYFHELIRQSNQCTKLWFNCIPDELCYVLAYASMEMENIGDRGFNKTLANAKSITKDKETGIKTYSSGDYPLFHGAVRDYNGHVMKLASKYKFKFSGWVDKRRWRK